MRGVKWLDCPRANSEWELLESELRVPDFRTWGHRQSLISPRLPSDLLWEILRQTGAVGFVAGMLHGSAAESGGLRGWSIWVLPHTVQAPHFLEGYCLSFAVRYSQRYLISHFSFLNTSFISSLYLWTDSSKDLEFHHENASPSRVKVSPCRLEVAFYCY